MIPKTPLGKLNLSKVISFPWQEKASDEIYNSVISWKKGVLLRAGTGIGKMYMVSRALRKLLEHNKLDLPPGSFNPFPVVYIIPANGVIQLRRVLADFGLSTKVFVQSYNDFRSDKNYMVEWKPTGKLCRQEKIITDETGRTSVIIEEFPELVPVWKKEFLPALVISDECQNFRNEIAQQTQTFLSLPLEVKVILLSATPFQRVCETAYFLIGCGVTTEVNQLQPTLKNVHNIQDSLAVIKPPEEYSPGNMSKFRELTKAFTVEVKGVRFKFKTVSKCIRAEFKRPEAREAYERAYQDYVDKCLKIGKNLPGGQRAKWVEFGKFEEKAENLRADILADYAAQDVADGKQVIIGAKYRNTLRATWAFLTRPKDKGGQEVSKDRIGWIVGGQKAEVRQDFVDKYQKGELDYILVMMKAGGTCLSLHHEAKEDWTPKYPLSKPRSVILPPTYHAIMLAQFLGRGHRLTSCSETTQKIIWMKDTVEEIVADKVDIKLKCISKACEAREQYASLITPDLDEEEDSEYKQEEDSEEEQITGEGLDNE